MIELKTDEFNIVLPHLSNLLKYNYILHSVIGGSVPGRIFVNDKENVETVLLWDKTNCAGIYIEGKYTPEIAKSMNKIIINLIIPEGKSIEDTKDITSCYAPIEVWEDKLITEVFKEVHIRKYHRRFFTFDKGVNQILQWRQHIPKEFRMIRFDENSPLLKDKDFKNLDSVIDMLKYSGDKIGCCIVDENEKIIVSWCTSDWRSGKFIEFGVETDEDYRQRGFGSACAAAAVEFALERGYEHIGWHCWDDNTASAKTALKAGYLEERSHPVMHFWYNNYDNMLLCVNYYYQKQDYQQAITYFENTEEMRNKDTEEYHTADLKIDYYHWILLRAIACYSKLNRIEKAYLTLKTLLNSKIDDPEDLLSQLQDDEDFSALKKSPKYQEIIDQIKNQIQN
ncbi:MAG: GNAT family N-acetyltransferase [Promethearchaeota archaeon]